MPRIAQTHVEVYVFRRRGRGVDFLCLRRSRDRVLGGTWQPITGKRNPRERAIDAARREMEEEIGIRPRRMWALETVTVYFDALADSVALLPLFAAEIEPRSRVRLSGEHDDFAFLSARAAGARFLWEAQRRGLDAVRREVLGRRRLAAALELGGEAASRPRRTRSASRPAHLTGRK